MKRAILTVFAVAGITTCSFGGQQIVLDNPANSGGPTATSNGQLYVYTPSGPQLFDGAHYDVGVTVWGGPTAGGLTMIGTFTPLNDPKGYTGLDLGKFQLGPAGVAVDILGVTGSGPAWIDLQFWIYNGPYATGTYENYTDAVVGKDPTANVLFQNPVGTTSSLPPTPPWDLVGMPSVIFVPEPSSLSLLVIGSILAACRRSWRS